MTTADEARRKLLEVKYHLEGEGFPWISTQANKEIFRDYLERIKEEQFGKDFYGNNGERELLLKLAAGELLREAGFSFVPLGYATPLGNKFFPQKQGNGWEQYYGGIGGVPINPLDPAITYRDSSQGTWNERQKEPQTIDVLIGHDLRTMSLGNIGEISKGHSLVVISFSPSEHAKARDKLDQLTTLYAKELLFHQNYFTGIIKKSTRLYFHPFQMQNHEALGSFICDCKCYYGKDALMKAVYDVEPVDKVELLRVKPREKIQKVRFSNQGEGI
ncbi:MAG: hypothetical protein WCV90_01390 [Candidatus Woesearchaeota archaeon]